MPSSFLSQDRTAMFGLPAAFQHVVCVNVLAEEYPDEE